MKVMEEEQVLSDRMQMVIGGVISLVLASAYIFFTGDRTAGTADEVLNRAPVIEQTTTGLANHDLPETGVVDPGEPVQSEPKPEPKSELKTEPKPEKAATDETL